MRVKMELYGEDIKLLIENINGNLVFKLEDYVTGKISELERVELDTFIKTMERIEMIEEKETKL